MSRDLDTVVRQASRADWPTVRPLLSEVGSVADAGIEGRFVERVSDPESLVLVALQGEALVGYAWVQSFGPHLRSGDIVARLHDLAVIPSHRRRGVGREIFEAVADWCRREGIRWLQWQASASAVGFYSRLGLAGDTKSDLEEHPFYELEFEQAAQLSADPSA